MVGAIGVAERPGGCSERLWSGKTRRKTSSIKLFARSLLETSCLEHLARMCLNLISVAFKCHHKHSKC